VAIVLESLNDIEDNIFMIPIANDDVGNFGSKR